MTPRDQSQLPPSTLGSNGSHPSVLSNGVHKKAPDGAPKSPKKRTRIVTFGILGFAFLAIALLTTALFVVQSAWFKNLIRERIESVVERATGGRVEIGSFSYNWRDLTAEVTNFVLHGTEPASAPPLFRAAKVQIGLRVISVLEKKVDIAALIVEKPQVYITINPDGSTNIPRPKVHRFNQNVIEDLLDLKVQHIELHHGMATYNTWRVPLDATGEQLQMSLA